MLKCCSHGENRKGKGECISTISCFLKWFIELFEVENFKKSRLGSFRLPVRLNLTHLCFPILCRWDVPFPFFLSFVFFPEISSHFLYHYITETIPLNWFLSLFIYFFLLRGRQNTVDSVAKARHATCRQRGFVRY